MFKPICQNKNFICFEDVRQYMRHLPAEDFYFDSQRYQYH